MSGIQGNLLLQGVQNASPWLSTDELLAPARQNSLIQRNELLNRATEQEMRAQDIEMIARASAYLDSLPEGERATAYPGVVQTLQAQGFARQAPSVYPGHERIKALAAMGTPSKELLEAANVQRALAGSGTTQYQTPPAGTGTTAGTTLAIPPRGTGGPGASVQMPPEYLHYFREASEKTGIPMDLLIAQARQESGFNPNARGAAGEIGIFQIKPSTAANPGFGMTGVDAATLNDPRANILFGAQYLKARGGANADFNDPRVQAAALAAYNGGGDPNYVANVFRYRPGMSPSDPSASVTTYATGGQPQPPVRGVAARTGGTDVAGPGAGTGGTTTAGGATPAATPQQPPAATTAAPGIFPPTPPQPTNGNGLTPAQQQTINTEKALVRTREQANAVLTKEQQYRDANVTAARQYQADQIAYQSAVNAQQAEARAQRGEGRQDQAAADTHAESLQRQRAAEAAALQPFTKDQLQQANTLRDEFTKQTETFRTVQTAYENIQTAAKADNGAGDMSMLYSYVKLLDPGSAVREGEFATAAQSGSFGQRIQGLVERVLSGARMGASLRKEFLTEARNIYQNNLKTHDQVADQYEALAKRAGLPSDLVVLRSARKQAHEPPPDPLEGRTATGPGGAKLVRRNGRWESVE